LCLLAVEPIWEAAALPLAKHLNAFLATRAGAGKDPD
jgi:hypothetical protein